MADPIRPECSASGPDSSAPTTASRSLGAPCGTRLGDSLAEAGNSALLVRGAGAVCAIPAPQVIETMRPLPIEPLGNAPNFVLGIALIRGAAVPIVELAAVLDASREPAMPSSHAGRFVTLRVGERCVALAVDSVAGLVQVNPQNLSVMPPLLNHACPDVVQAIGTLDAELLLVLETARLVPESVWSELDKVQAGAP